VNDLLYFTGDTKKLLELTQNEKLGVTIHKANKYRIDQQSDVIETLIPITSELEGKKVRETNFRERYEGAIVAIHRNGEKIDGKIGDVRLQFGDMLLVIAGAEFYSRVKSDKNLYVISAVSRKSGENKKKEKKLFLVILSFFVFSMAFQILDIFIGLLGILSSLFILKLYSFKELKKQLNLELLIILVSSLTLGTSLLESGTAEVLNQNLFALINGSSPFVLMLTIFIITVILTSFITNVAAVSIVFPLAAALVQSTGIPAKPIFLAIAFAASAAFLTPVSYQTNLMVMGPGGYFNRDFLKSGTLLTVLYCLICTAYLYLQL
jgi:di/tricarboxylate transporter